MQRKLVKEDEKGMTFYFTRYILNQIKEMSIDEDQLYRLAPHQQNETKDDPSSKSICN